MQTLTKTKLTFVFRCEKFGVILTKFVKSVTLQEAKSKLYSLHPCLKSWKITLSHMEG